ncbi:MAG: hypothetical protein AB1467_04270 [Candidatus Diapherotrites archaeon]
MLLKPGSKKIGTLSNYFLKFKGNVPEIESKLASMPAKKVAGEMGIPVHPFEGFMKHFNLTSTRGEAEAEQKERRFLKGSFWNKKSEIDQRKF